MVAPARERVWMREPPLAAKTRRRINGGDKGSKLEWGAASCLMIKTQMLPRGLDRPKRLPEGFA
jgi:hypothetical protein